MLQLQRASAGSGKTYMLAKKYIEYFISVRDEEGTRRLRSPRELRESLSHILAITFTNKATNEMKLRIVEKLDALGRWQPGNPIGEIDYLAEFCESFRCSPADVTSICRHALRTLLTDYSDFKVSTIDSFFQTVLRTFAYEADLDDTYQLELDSNYVTQLGLDSTLDEVELTDRVTPGLTWVEQLMEDKATRGRGWNIFQKKSIGNSVYAEVLNASRNLAKEDFKEIRESLDRYFAENPDFFSTVRKLSSFYETTAREAFTEMVKAAREVRDAFADAGLDMETTAGSYLASRVRKMAGEWKWDTIKEEEIKFKIPEFTRKGATTRVFHPKAENPYFNTETEDHIESLAIRMYESFDAWRSEIRSDKMKRWLIYRATLPYVGLLQSVSNNTRQFLTDANTVELGETNSILNRIIGDEDAPFIYERLGNRLEHFLIDEFQDTSRLQWKNMYPLMLESEGKGFDNLIIGDAKQSIYRFRNADPSLITTHVPMQFSETCRECGNTPEENTNWRSSRRIVEFNNLFFRHFTSAEGVSAHMERLYTNTVQPPHHKEDYGFVSVRLFKKESGADVPEHFDEIPLMIADMLDRGYAMKDIAVLVDTREQGGKVIEKILAYNRNDSRTREIHFISADSLRLGESPAVQTVVAILEAINNGTRAELRPPEERRKKGIGDWSKLKADFSFFAMQNEGEPLSELLRRFLNGEYDPEAIRNMLGEMSTTVLPALVENIIQHFLTDNMRESEAPFLAALQDSVIDFCEGYTSDIASFLRWWDKKGSTLSISSPEDTDAVQIMTVHKSKGLEFRCVIVPWSKQTIRPISPHEREWIWVIPDLSEVSDIAPIPRIPVWSDPKLADTSHAKAYEEYLRLYLTDKVNMAYVAFTRAIDELYIFTPCDLDKEGQPAMGKGRIGEYLWDCGRRGDEIIREIRSAYPETATYLPDEGEFHVDKENLNWTFGKKPEKSEVLAATEKKKKKEARDISKPVKEYRCGIIIPALKYTDPSSPEDSLLPEDKETEAASSAGRTDTDSNRETGELLHRVMEHVDTPSDLPRALLKMKSGGWLNARELPELQAKLEASIDSVESYGWFDEGVRVIKERGIVVRGRLLRPDRIIVKEDGSGVIVDYKFGDQRNDKVYSRQVRNYARALMQTGTIKKCEAYIWYVSLGEVVKVGSI